MLILLATVAEHENRLCELSERQGKVKGKGKGFEVTEEMKRKIRITVSEHLYPYIMGDITPDTINLMEKLSKKLARKKVVELKKIESIAFDEYLKTSLYGFYKHLGIAKMEELDPNEKAVVTLFSANLLPLTKRDFPKKKITQRVLKSSIVAAVVKMNQERRARLEKVRPHFDKSRVPVAPAEPLVFRKVTLDVPELKFVTEIRKSAVDLVDLPFESHTE